MYKPPVISLDVETALLSGQPSTDFFRHDFRCTSAAFAWRQENGDIKELCLFGEPAIRRFLDKCLQDGVKFVVHNAAFEWAVLRYRFGEAYTTPLAYDTMRLVQVFDNGGSDREQYSEDIDSVLAELEGKKEPSTGLGLQVACKRVLGPEHHGHKKPWHELIVQRGAPPGKEGENLHLLTKDELGAYNCADARVTLLLYERLIEVFKSEGYDWSLDHFLYLDCCKRVSEAKYRGVPVDRDSLSGHIGTLKQKLGQIWDTFNEKFALEIAQLERWLLEKELSKFKTGAKLAAIQADPPRFNPRSTQQKARLFIDIMGIKPIFFVYNKKKKNQDAPPAPSFSSKFARQWGEGGLMLKSQGTVMIELKQSENLLALSEYDGRWHISLRVASTRNGRLSGGG
jgi:hypothetical protein